MMLLPGFYFLFFVLVWWRRYSLRVSPFLLHVIRSAFVPLII